MQTAEGYYEPDDLVDYCKDAELVVAIAKALAEFPSLTPIDATNGKISDWLIGPPTQ